MPSNASDLSKQFDSKSLLQNLTQDDFKALKEAQRYHYFARNLKTAAWLSIIGGGLFLWQNTTCCQRNISDYLEIIQGVVLLIWGLWAVAAQSLRSYLALSIVTLGFAVIELVIAVLHGPIPFRLVLAVIFLWSAIRIYRDYQQQKLRPPVKPHPSVARLYKLIGNLFRELNFKSDPEAIELNIKRYRWRGWLFGEYAMFGWKKDKSNILIVRKSNVQFAPNKEGQLAKKRIDGTSK